MTTKDERPLTGRMVLAITVSAFAVIVGANMALLWAAVGSFPGLEVKNSYVASQNFDRERAAQEALGWTATVSYSDDRLTLILTGADGRAVAVRDVAGVVGRTTHQADDQVLAFAPGAQGFDAPLRLAPGNWMVHVEAVAEDGTAFRQRLELHVRSGE